MRSCTFLYFNVRGDQALSIGGKHNPVQCLNRWQNAVEKKFFFLKNNNFWKLLDRFRVNEGEGKESSWEDKSSFATGEAL